MSPAARPRSLASMKTHALLLALAAGMLAGCGSLPAKAETNRAEKLVWPVRKLLLVHSQRPGSRSLGTAFGDRLLAEIQRRLDAHDIPSVALAFDSLDVDTEAKVRAAIADHHPSHQLWIGPAFVRWAGGPGPNDLTVRELAMGFVLSELYPFREVWKGQAAFIGRPYESEIAETVVSRMATDRLLER